MDKRITGQAGGAGLGVLVQSSGADGPDSRVAWGGALGSAHTHTFSPYPTAPGPESRLLWLCTPLAFPMAPQTSQL